MKYYLSFYDTVHASQRYCKQIFWDFPPKQNIPQALGFNVIKIEYATPISLKEYRLLRKSMTKYYPNRFNTFILSIDLK